MFSALEVTLLNFNFAILLYRIFYFANVRHFYKSELFNFVVSNCDFLSNSSADMIYKLQPVSLCVLL